MRLIPALVVIAILLLFITLSALAKEPPPLWQARVIRIKELNISLVCWRVQLPDGTEGDETVWPARCAPPRYIRLCTETPTVVDCWSAVQPPGAPEFQQQPTPQGGPENRPMGLKWPF